MLNLNVKQPSQNQYGLLFGCATLLFAFLLLQKPLSAAPIVGDMWFPHVRGLSSNNILDVFNGYLTLI